MTVFHSNHLPQTPKLSGRSNRRQKTLSCQSNRRQKTFTAGDFSSKLFRRRLFPTPQGAPGGDLQFFPKHRSQKTTHAPATRVFPAGDCISRASTWGRVSHFPTTRFLLQPRLTPTSHPSYLFLPSEPCMCLFWGSFASAGPPNSFSGVLRLFFLNPNPCTCLGKCSSTFPMVPRLFFFSIWSLTRAILRFFLLRPHLKPY